MSHSNTDNKSWYNDFVSSHLKINHRSFINFITMAYNTAILKLYLQQATTRIMTSIFHEHEHS